MLDALRKARDFLALFWEAFFLGGVGGVGRGCTLHSEVALAEVIGVRSRGTAIDI